MLLDDRKGSVNQAKGVAKALGNRIDVVEKNIAYNKLAVLPNWLKGRTLLGVNKQKSDDLSSPYPDIVLSTSRRTVATARYIRKKSQNKTKIIQLMYPADGIGICDMEKIIVPAHDSLKKRQNPKSFVITGAPTTVTTKMIEESKRKWEPVFADLPRPWVSVIVGGAIKGKPWPLTNAEKLGEKICEINSKIGGSVFITSSRRTGKEAEEIIMNKIKKLPLYTYIWGEKKENPLNGFYACSDIIIVTADSVSMASEACGTGKPVLLFRDKNWLPKKHQSFAQSLIDGNYAADLFDEKALSFKPEKTLNTASIIAEEILKTLK